MKRAFMVLLPALAVALVAVVIMHPLIAHAFTGRSHILKARQAVYANAASNLIYHGGPIMPGTMRAFAIFWEPAGSSVSSRYNSLILRYLRDIGSSPLYHNNVQYKDAPLNRSTSAALADYWIDTAAYPSRALSDVQIQQEVKRAMSVNGWGASLTHAFLVFTAKGENICVDGACSFSRFCGYHNFFGANTIYAVLPYSATDLADCGIPSSPNGDIDADSTINIASHEQIEAATDPFLNAWYDSTGEEIGDKCAWHFGGTVTWNGHPYLVQKEWDNAKRKCVLAGP